MLETWVNESFFSRIPFTGDMFYLSQAIISAKMSIHKYIHN